MQEVDKKVDSKPEPPFAGVVYGEITYWVVLAGMLISLSGVIMILTTESNYIDSACLLNDLWAGKDPGEIWETCTGVHEEGHWYLNKLNTGDGIAMLGIALSCLAAVMGVWLSSFALLRSREMLFFVFSVITAIILTASSTGLINVGH
jgi:hypothetical protein